MGFFYRWEALNRKLRRVGKFPRIVRRVPMGHGESSKRVPAIRFVRRKSPKIPPFMKHISYGSHLIKCQPFGTRSSDFNTDSIEVYVVHIGDTDVLFYGVFDAQVGDEIIRYLKYYVYSEKLNENKITKQVKAVLSEAYVSAGESINNRMHGVGGREWGAASVAIIRREKIVAASMGNYSAVVCRNGVAHEIHDSRIWEDMSLISGELFDTSKPEIGVKGIHSSTEFIILASAGIWKVMGIQEAVFVVRNRDDPQEAAKELATEANNRLGEGKIACAVICIR